MSNRNDAWGGHPLGSAATTRRLNEVFGETPPATEAPQGRLTKADIKQIAEGIEHFIMNGDPLVDEIWQPYIDKLRASVSSEAPVYGSEVLCEQCAVVFCQSGERLHFHHDGCPACCGIALGRLAHESVEDHIAALKLMVDARRAELDAPVFTRFVAAQCDDQIMVIKADGDTPDVGQVLYLASEVDAVLVPAPPASLPERGETR